MIPNQPADRRLILVFLTRLNDAFLLFSHQAVIKEGARTVVVPGQLPTGCIPIMLTLYASPNKRDYDSTGCLRKYNALARYHNAVLFESVYRLRQKYPAAKIVYADYYAPLIAFLKKPKTYGERFIAFFLCYSTCLL